MKLLLSTGSVFMLLALPQFAFAFGAQGSMGFNGYANEEEYSKAEGSKRRAREARQARIAEQARQARIAEQARQARIAEEARQARIAEENRIKKLYRPPANFVTRPPVPNTFVSLRPKKSLPSFSSRSIGGGGVERSVSSTSNLDMIAKTNIALGKTLQKLKELENKSGCEVDIRGIYSCPKYSCSDDGRLIVRNNFIGADGQQQMSFGIGAKMKTPVDGGSGDQDIVKTGFKASGATK